MEDFEFINHRDRAKSAAVLYAMYTAGSVAEVVDKALQFLAVLTFLRDQNDNCSLFSFNSVK